VILIGVSLDRFICSDGACTDGERLPHSAALAHLTSASVCLVYPASGIGHRLNSTLLDLDRRAFGRAVGIINAVVAFLGSQPAQASWAMINEFGGLAAHRFLHLSFADRAGHHAVPNDALMNVPPVVLLTQSLVHDECNQPQKATERNITIMNAIILSNVLRLVLCFAMPI
jgi:hypothetical protein